MKLQQDFKEDAKYFLLRAFPYVVIVVLLFVMFKSCLNESIDGQDLDKRYDSLEVAYKVLENEKDALYNHSIVLAFQLQDASRKVDSLSIISAKTANNWHKNKPTKRDSLIKYVCDTAKVISIYDGMVSLCDSMRTTDSLLIKGHEVKESKLEETVANRDSMILNRDNTIKLDNINLGLKDIEISNEKKKKWKFLGIGIGVGILATSILIIAK